MRRDRLPPKEKKAVSGSSSGAPVQRLIAGTGGFFDGLLRAQRTAAVLALQRLGGNQAACSTMPTLRCTARANYSHTRSIQVSAPVRTDGGSWEATGTLVARFTANPTIQVPSLPRGLSKCARAKMKELLETELMPHEKEHKARFLSRDPANAYVGSVTERVTGTGSTARAAQRDALEQCRERFQALLAERTARNRQYAIDEIDPFSVTADISDCPECQPPSKD